MAAHVFLCYSREDEQLRNQLEKQLTVLKRAGLVETWHDRRLIAGDEWDREIRKELERADIILLLVSADFLASDYVQDVEIERAMQRHEAGEARIIPVILKPCHWRIATFSKLQTLPKDSVPVTKWANPDDAFLDIAQGIEEAVRSLKIEPSTGMRGQPARLASAVAPRSGNLRVAKTFSDHDKDNFKHEAFAFIQRYFDASLKELEARNPELATRFRLIDADRFTATVYRDGKKVAACTVCLSSMMGDVLYSGVEDARDNACNESLRVHADAHSLHLKATGLSMMYGRGQKEEEKLSMEGGAELFWSIFIRPLQD